MYEPFEYYKNLSLLDIEGEIWVDVKGYEGVYKVSNLGRIKSLKRAAQRMKKQYLNHEGYCYIKLSKNNTGKSLKVHRIVAITWLPNPCNKLTVNHKKGVKTDNRVTELEWATQKEQGSHAAINGLIPSGESHHMFGKKGSKHHTAKIVLQYNLKGEFVKKWGSIIEASKDLKINRADISACYKGKLKRAGNFQWVLFNEGEIKNIPEYVPFDRKSVFKK